MTRKYLGHPFKNYQHNKRHFNEPMQATVHIFSPQNLLFYADKSILRALIWLVRLIHALYRKKNIGYNGTPTLPVLMGGPLRFQKRPIRSSIQTELHCQNCVLTHNDAL